VPRFARHTTGRHPVTKAVCLCGDGYASPV
jgi:hypothetical protein